MKRWGKVRLTWYFGVQVVFLYLETFRSEKFLKKEQLIFQAWTVACKNTRIFMDHNCVLMLNFKQNSIRCTSSGWSVPLVQIKSLAGAERERERQIAAELWVQLNGRAAHDSAHLAPVQHLGWVSGVKHRSFKPPLQAGYPENGKTEFLRVHWRAHFRKVEFGDFIIGGENKPDTIVFSNAASL